MEERQTSSNTGSLVRHQMELRDFMAIMLRRKWVFLSLVVPICLVALIGVLRTTESFTAATQLLVEARSPISPNLRQVGSVDYEVLMSTEAQLAASMPVAELAAEALLDSLPRLRQLDPELAVETEQELARFLVKYVDAEAVGSSNILKLTFTHTNPEFACIAADALAKSFIRFSVESQQNTSAIDYYTEQIEMLQAELDSLIALRADVYAKGSFNALPSAVQGGVAEIQRMEYDYYTARAKREGLQRKLDFLERAVASNPDYLPAVGAGENDALVAAKRNLEAEKAKLAQLRSVYTDDSVWVRRQQEIVKQAADELYRIRDEYIQHLRMELESLRGTEESLQKAIESSRHRLVDYPDIVRQVESLDMQISAQKDLLESLQLKRGEVRLAAESDVRISNITQLDVPHIEAGIGGSRKILYLGLVFILTLILGVVVTIFVDNQDHRIADRRAAELALDVPVLGSIRDSDKEGGGT